VEKQRRIQEREARELRYVEEELESLSLGVYQGEIVTIEALIKHLNSLVPTEKTLAEKQQAIVPDDADRPARSVVIVPKSERQDDYFVGGGKKKGKQSNTSNADRPLKFDLELLGSFGLLSINIPKFVSEIPNTITLLEEKKQYFVENSAIQTEIKRKELLEKIKVAVKEEEE
jgi:hypothetical protein